MNKINQFTSISTPASVDLSQKISTKCSSVCGSVTMKCENVERLHESSWKRLFLVLRLPLWDSSNSLASHSMLSLSQPSVTSMSLHLDPRGCRSNRRKFCYYSPCSCSFSDTVKAALTCLVVLGCCCGMKHSLLFALGDSFPPTCRGLCQS